MEPQDTKPRSIAILWFWVQYPLEIYEKSILEYGMSQVNFRERIGRILRDWIPCHARNDRGGGDDKTV